MQIEKNGVENDKVCILHNSFVGHGYRILAFTQHLQPNNRAYQNKATQGSICSKILINFLFGFYQLVYCLIFFTCTKLGSRGKGN